MSFDKNSAYALVGVSTSGECMTKVDDKYYYPTVDGVTLDQYKKFRIYRCKLRGV